MQLSSFLKDFQSSEITSDAKLDLSHVEIRPCKRSKLSVSCRIIGVHKPDVTV